MYHYEEKNKFPHLILLEKPPECPGQDGRHIHKNRIEWLNENIGKHGIDWNTTAASVLCGKKHYWGKYPVHRTNSKIRWDVKSAYQYGFKDKETAMRFKLMWG